MQKDIEFLVDKEVSVSLALKFDCVKYLDLIEAETKRQYAAKNYDKTMELLNCYNMVEEMSNAGQKMIKLLYEKNKYTETYLNQLKQANSEVKAKLSVVSNAFHKIVTNENDETK